MNHATCDMRRKARSKWNELQAIWMARCFYTHKQSFAIAANHSQYITNILRAPPLKHTEKRVPLAEYTALHCPPIEPSDNNNNDSNCDDRMPYTWNMCGTMTLRTNGSSALSYQMNTSPESDCLKLNTIEHRIHTFYTALGSVNVKVKPFFYFLIFVNMAENTWLCRRSPITLCSVCDPNQYLFALSTFASSKFVCLVV